MLPLMKTNIKFYDKEINTFGGINQRQDYLLGELTMSENMSSKNFPFLSSRRVRSFEKLSGRTINSLWGYDGLFYTSYTSEGKMFLTYNGKDYEFTNYTSADCALKRKFASIKDEILIIPDNIVFNINTKKFKRASFSHTNDIESAKTKFVDEYKGKIVTEVEEADYIGRLYTDKIGARKLTYTKNSKNCEFYFLSFPQDLKEGDIVDVKVSVHANTYDDSEFYEAFTKKLREGFTAKIKSLTKVSHNIASGKLTEFTEIEFEDYKIDMTGLGIVYVGSCTIERKMPSLESICSFSNRVWGISGKGVFASKLADATEWNDFSIDEYGTLPYASFNAEASTEGKFTSIIPYGNYIYAFKENSIHKIYGDSPDEYVLSSKQCQGVAQGFGESVCMCSAGIIFPSDDGIYRYTSDATKKISESIKSFGTFLSGASNEEFCYFLTRKDERLCLFVYDLNHDIWHSEDVPGTSQFLTSYKNKIYLATKDEIYCLTDNHLKTNEKPLPNWKFRMRVDDKFFNKKGYGKLMMRYSLSKNASFTVRALYDDGGKGAICGACYDEATGSLSTLYLPIKRCNWFDLEFSGQGDFVLKGMKLKFYRGSEI